MTLASKRAGTQFHKPKQKSGKLTPAEWAAIMVMKGFPRNPKVIAEGLATLEVESGFDSRASNSENGGHDGAWQEEQSYGTAAQRFDPVTSTGFAYNHWKSDGESFEPEWGQYDGHGWRNFAKWMKTAEAITKLTSGETPGSIGSRVNTVAGEASNTIESAEEFLQRLAETLLDFRKLGNLAVQAFAWFLRLLLKALWDYVIAPMLHWTERATSFYWNNYFGVGTEQGSGLGFQLRNNAGGITILFWALGYAVLWTDGSSPGIVSPHESLAGQSVKTAAGLIARRNLIKPAKVKEKTPAKPTPKISTVPIQRKQTFSVARKRPVSVATAGATPVETTGRKAHASSERFRGHRVPKPGAPQTQTIQRQQRAVAAQRKKQAAAQTASTAQPSGAGLDTRKGSPAGNPGNPGSVK